MQESLFLLGRGHNWMANGLMSNISVHNFFHSPVVTRRKNA